MTAPGVWYASTEGEDVFSMEIISVSGEEVVYDAWLNVPTGTGLEHAGRRALTLVTLDGLLEEGRWVVLSTPAEVSGS